MIFFIDIVTLTFKYNTDIFYFNTQPIAQLFAILSTTLTNTEDYSTTILQQPNTTTRTNTYNTNY